MSTENVQTGAGAPDHLHFLDSTREREEPVRGRFIACDGIDGTGKSTLLAMLEAYLTVANVNHILTKQPGGSPLGDKIRDILFKTPGTHEIDNDAIECLFLANHLHNTRRVVEPALRDGVHVVADRHWPSAVAYMEQRGADQRLRDVYQQFRGPEHDLLLLLIGDPSIMAERAAKRGGGEGADGKQAKKKWASSEKLAVVQKKFMDSFASDPRTIVVNTTNRCPEDLIENVIAPVVFMLIGVKKPSFGEVFSKEDV